MSSYLVLAPLVMVALGVAFLRLFHAKTRTRCKLLEKDDLFFRKVCRSGLGSLVRGFYRGLPSNPRCRLLSRTLRGNREDSWIHSSFIPPLRTFSTEAKRFAVPVLGLAVPA